jgi:hypothetical protein
MNQLTIAAPKRPTAQIAPKQAQPQQTQPTVDRFERSAPVSSHSQDRFAKATDMALCSAIPGVGAMANAGGGFATLLLQRYDLALLSGLGAASNIIGLGSLIAYAVTGNSGFAAVGAAGLGLSAAAGGTASYLIPDKNSSVG